jgi:hypothetical protein
MIFLLLGKDVTNIVETNSKIEMIQRSCIFSALQCVSNASSNSFRSCKDVWNIGKITKTAPMLSDFSFVFDVFIMKVLMILIHHTRNTVYSSNNYEIVFLVYR